MNLKSDEEKLMRFFMEQVPEKEDSEYVNSIFCDNEKDEDLRHSLRKHFYSLLAKNAVAEKDLDSILHKIHYNINTIQSESTRSRYLDFINKFVRVAAFIILPLAIFMGVKSYFKTNIEKETWIAIEAPAWTRAQFSLPDGTTGWLNSNSSLKYFGNYSSDRKIILNGEAYFDVITDEKRPFRVDANGIELEVTGTKFNIASFQDENDIEVVLDEGRVRIKNTESLNAYSLKPNEMIVYNKVMKTMSTKVVEPEKYISWTEGKLSFRNDPIEVVARRIGRWYNVNVEMQGNFHDNLRLRATFIDESLEEVLYMLKLSLPVDYKVEKSSMGSDNIYTKKKVIIYMRN